MSNKTVMIVDDSAMIRKMLVRTLGPAGFNFVEAVDGQDAWEKLDETIDCIICDVNMPRMNGIEFLEEVSKSPKFSPPVLMLTTEAAPELIQQARQLGAVGWMVKPPRPDLLLAATKKMASGDNGQQKCA